MGVYLFGFLIVFPPYFCLCYTHIIQKRLTGTELLNHMHESTAPRCTVKQSKWNQIWFSITVLFEKLLTETLPSPCYSICIMNHRASEVMFKKIQQHSKNTEELQHFKAFLSFHLLHLKTEGSKVCRSRSQFHHNEGSASSFLAYIHSSVPSYKNKFYHFPSADAQIYMSCSLSCHAWLLLPLPSWEQNWN